MDLQTESETPAAAGADVLTACAFSLLPDVALFATDRLLHMLSSPEEVDKLGLPVISEAAPSLKRHAYGWHAWAPLAQLAALRAHRAAILAALAEQVRGEPPARVAPPRAALWDCAWKESR